MCMRVATEIIRRGYKHKMNELITYLWLCNPHTHDARAFEKALRVAVQSFQKLEKNRCKP